MTAGEDSRREPPERVVRAPGAATQGALRRSNLALVLRSVLGADAPISRAQVAAETLLTRSTVSRLVDELVAADLVCEAGLSTSRAPGRPGTLLVPGERPAALGMQINAGYLAVRALTLSGRVVFERVDEDDLVGADPVGTMTRLGVLAREAHERVRGSHSWVGARLALPGLMDHGLGRLLRAPNLGWTDVDPERLKGSLGELGLTVRLGNEADLAAVTVSHDAPGRPGAVSDFIYLSGEIGIGGAAVLAGRRFGGSHGWAGEIGHVCVDSRGPACRCGSTGCLEQYAGRRALLAASGLAPTASVAALVKAIGSGSPRASSAVAQASWALAVALGGAINLLDIPVVVLGGHLSDLGEWLRPALERELASRVLSAGWVAPSVMVAPPDVAPGATGGAMDVLSQLVENPAEWLDAH